MELGATELEVDELILATELTTAELEGATLDTAIAEDVVATLAVRLEEPVPSPVHALSAAITSPSVSVRAMGLKL